MMACMLPSPLMCACRCPEAVGAYLAGSQQATLIQLAQQTARLLQVPALQ